jgi:DNA polymerase III epsilon subunit-like protein
MKEITEVVFFDTETTGKEAEDRLCQMGYIHESFVEDKQLSFMNLMFKPPLPIKIDAMCVHHITNEMVDGLKSFEEVAKKTVKELFEREDVVCVAHNATFDVEMLKKEGIEPANVIDTLKVARKLDKGGVIPSHALQYLRYFLKLEVTDVQAHDAFGDVKVLAALFARLFDKMQDDGENVTLSSRVLEQMIEISKHPSLIPRFNFGKYKGEKIADIAKRDMGYLRWLKESESSKGDAADKDMLYTLKQNGA